MTTVNVNGVALGIESFGEDDAPRVGLVGATTMFSWPNALCERLAGGGRRVVRYDLRDRGESTTSDPEAPSYIRATSPRPQQPSPKRSAASPVAVGRTDSPDRRGPGTLAATTHTNQR